MPDQTPSMPPLPEIDPRMCIPYDSIRYIAGYHEGYVKEYAAAYARAALSMAYNAMFDIKGDKATRFDAQIAIRDLADQLAPKAAVPTLSLGSRESSGT